jgi:ABC-2 type transport system ATP-binding protein
MVARYAVQTEHLSKTYHLGKGNEVRAVSDVGLGIEAGQVFGFLGPNGAGKTTTLKMVCGLVRPSSGVAWIHGQDVWRHRSAAVSQIGAVLEGERNTHWEVPALDNVLWFGMLRGMSGRRLRTRAEDLLRQIELWDRRKDLVREFSRGMKQKLSVACALVANPPVLLLDEPTLGLDVQAARTVKAMIKRLAGEEGRTVILTTHEMKLAEELCDRVAIISRGRIVADEPVSELLDLFAQEHYEIVVEGQMQEAMRAGLEGLVLAQRNGHSVLSGPLLDQGHLYRVLDHLRQSRLPLLSVNRADPDLEEVFVRLLDGDAQKGVEQ